IVAIVLVIGISYYWTSASLADKNSEISSLQESLTEKSSEIATLKSYIENVQSFEKLLLKGISHQEDGLVNVGYGKSDYDDFSRNYEAGFYDAAQGYAESVDIFYGYAVNCFESAKARFEQARRYAPNDKYLQLIDNYINATECGRRLYNEMHQVGEYFASACNYYFQGLWSTGDKELEEGNIHLEAHDNLVPIYNEYLANIDTLLDDW
ncbi:unnamed protein product, partial [marine sediment metagenome]